MGGDKKVDGGASEEERRGSKEEKWMIGVKGKKKGEERSIFFVAIFANLFRPPQKLCLYFLTTPHTEEFLFRQVIIKPV